MLALIYQHHGSYDFFKPLPMSRQVTAQAKIEAVATCYGYEDVASSAPYVVGLQDTKSGWCRMRSAINPLLGCTCNLGAGT
jgi:hypothetical protein